MNGLGRLAAVGDRAPGAAVPRDAHRPDVAIGVADARRRATVTDAAVANVQRAAVAVGGAGGGRAARVRAAHRARRADAVGIDRPWRDCGARSDHPRQRAAVTGTVAGGVTADSVRAVAARAL